MAGGQWGIVVFTLKSALLSTLAILPVGIALAWLLAKRQWRGKTVVETLVSLPLVMPPVATGLILLMVVGRRGLVGKWLYERGIEIPFTATAVVLALAVMSFPLLVRSARVAFEEVSPRLEQIAATLGSSGLRIFFTVTLPLAARGVLAGAVLAFSRALGEFGATVIVAGNIPGKTQTLSLAIFQAVQVGRDAEALHLLEVTVVIAFLTLGMSERLGRSRKRGRQSA